MPNKNKKSNDTKLPPIDKGTLITDGSAVVTECFTTVCTSNQLEAKLFIDASNNSDESSEDSASEEGENIKHQSVGITINSKHISGLKHWNEDDLSFCELSCERWFRLLLLYFPLHHNNYRENDKSRKNRDEIELPSKVLRQIESELLEIYKLDMINMNKKADDGDDNTSEKFLQTFYKIVIVTSVVGDCDEEESDTGETPPSVPEFSRLPGRSWPGVLKHKEKLSDALLQHFQTCMRKIYKGKLLQSLLKFKDSEHELLQECVDSIWVPSISGILFTLHETRSWTIPAGGKSDEKVLAPFIEIGSVMNVIHLPYFLDFSNFKLICNIIERT